MAPRKDILVVRNDSPGPKYNVTYPDHRIHSSMDLQKERKIVLSDKTTFAPDHSYEAAEEKDRLNSITSHRKHNFSHIANAFQQNKAHVINQLSIRPPRYVTKPTTFHPRVIPFVEPFSSQSKRKSYFDPPQDSEDAPTSELHVDKSLKFLDPHIETFIYKPLYVFH